MYEQFFGLLDKPFSLTPNPRFVFYSRQYREAEGQLLYGINNREGFMLVTGQPGTGKTTLCRDLIEKLDREKTSSALIFNPFLNGTEMLAALLTEFGLNVPPAGTRKDLLDRLNQFLLAQLAIGKACVAIFDEAQHLSPEFLEQIRVLSNLETDQEKLIQIVLVGQPELLDKVRTPQMAQLDQRVSIRCTLTHLDEQETDRYIHHRLNVAGARGQIRITPQAVKEIYRASRGVPRLINLMSDRALLAAFAAQTRDVGPEHVRKAVAALRGEDSDVAKAVGEAMPSARRWPKRVAAIAAVLIIAAASIGVALWPRRTPPPADDAPYWKAVSAPTAADAERELQAFVTSYPTSSHVNEALLRLAQLENSHGDHAAAVARFAQVAQRTPAGDLHARALVLGALAGLDAADTAAVCRNTPGELATLAASDSTLTREAAEVTAVCAARLSAAHADSAATPAVAAADTVASAQKTAPKGRP